MKIQASTTPYAVLGHPVKHSLSPLMHNIAFERLGLDGVYLALDVLPEQLGTILPAMRDMGFGGVNLTIPHKEMACSCVDVLDPSAQRLGAANTIHFRDDGKIVGHNTDGWGFAKAVTECFDFSFTGSSLFILGTGGAGRAVALTAVSKGATCVVLADVDIPRAQSLADELVALSLAVKTVVTNLSDGTDWLTQADLVVHATPVGMKTTDPSLVAADLFREGQCVFDLIYMYPETPILKEARKAGAKISNGLDMLLYQGVRAFEIWTGQVPPVAAMREVLTKAVYCVDD